MAAMRVSLVVTLGALLAGASAGCSSDGAKTQPSASSTSATSVAAPVESVSPRTGPRLPADVREGGALARGIGEAALYVADEDHRTLRRIPLPVDPANLGKTLALPGAPAQVLPLDGRVLVTVRDPGLLVAIERDATGELVERGRVALPDDAWGIAVTKDESTALVTSAWTGRISAVDLKTMALRWSIEASREPRAIAIRSDGRTAYVTHLIGGAVTRLDAIDDGFVSAPKVSKIALPPAPLRSPSGVTLDASLGYTALLSPDESRLFVARHALGALGEDAWFGASTVDVLVTARDEALAPRHHARLAFLRADKATAGEELIVPPKPLSPFTQPRALAFRKRTRTLLVASEGDDLVAELDADAVDPTRAVLTTYPIGAQIDPAFGVATSCGAPAGLVLSEDEGTAWVWCRATYDLATVPLLDFAPDSAPEGGASKQPPTIARVADDPIAEAAIGRRLFYNATDRVTSGGLACAGCHPEGRDDGHVWREARINTKDGTHTNFLGNAANIPEEEGVRGVPRRTPMLAGNVGAAGPYGWHGESPTLPARLVAGFGLHRWGGQPAHEPVNAEARALRLVTFLRQGLVTPPPIRRALTETEKRGQVLFNSAEVGCATCHAPDSDYTGRAVFTLPKIPTRPGYDDEENGAFKTPSLRFVGGRAPYLHDGRAPSLEWIIDNNKTNRMGMTEQLSSVDRAALVAFLRTL